MSDVWNWYVYQMNEIGPGVVALLAMGIYHKVTTIAVARVERRRQPNY